MAELQTDHSVRWNAQNLRATDQAIFSPEDRLSFFTALDIGFETQGLRFAATLNNLKDGKQRSTYLSIAEAFYDFTQADWLFSVGKKKLDWDVGYGFRPLDLFSPTDSLAIYNAVPPGAVMLVGDYFTDSGNLSLLCNETRPDYLNKGIKVAKSLGCGGRYYQYFEHLEGQLIAHYDQQLGLRIGGSAQTVMGDSLELHGSLLWQEHYRTPHFNQSASGQTAAIPRVTTQWQTGALQTLLGVNYSLASGITLIAEYWYDGRAPSHDQWQAVIKTSQKNPSKDIQRRLRGHFATQNLFRHNLMLHLRTNHPVWQPELTGVFNPEDNSVLINGKLCYYGTQDVQFCAGGRQFSGGRNAIYEQLGDQTSRYLEINITF